MMDGEQKKKISVFVVLVLLAAGVTFGVISENSMVMRFLRAFGSFNNFMGALLSLSFLGYYVFGKPNPFTAGNSGRQPATAENPGRKPRGHILISLAILALALGFFLFGFLNFKPSAADNSSLKLDLAGTGGQNAAGDATKPPVSPGAETSPGNGTGVTTQGQGKTPRPPTTNGGARRGADDVSPIETLIPADRGTNAVIGEADTSASGERIRPVDTGVNASIGEADTSASGERLRPVDTGTNATVYESDTSASIEKLKPSELDN